VEFRKDLRIPFDSRGQNGNDICTDPVSPGHLLVSFEGNIDFLQDLYLFLQEQGPSLS
jgi:hypothetical protein